MIDKLAFGPLSPPTSPRMSDTAGKIEGIRWEQASDAARSTQCFAAQKGSADTPSLSTLRTKDATARPQLRSIKSFPYSLGPSSRVQSDTAHESLSGSGSAFKEQVLSQGPQPTASANLPQPTFGGSAPTSPIERLTPRSQEAAAGHDEGSMDDEDEMDVEGLEQEDDADKPPMTAAELRAHKRKMKRFRLTHNQTRFLMSEFARQPHPDAAHRERLSREIPGLSPRQVQVWFQNRRAKLKRLTTDDRERMMRSRALPADFDMMQALRAPFGAPTPTSGTPDASPSGLSSFNNPGGVRPLTLDTLRRVPEYEPFGQNYGSPTGITPAIGSFGFTPPQSATDTISPSSAIGMSPFAFPSQDSPRRPGYGLSLNTQAGYAAQNAQMARHHLHERFGRPLGDIAGSPLRSSISYSGLPSTSQGQTPTPTQVRSNSMSEHGHYTHDRPANPRSATYSNMGSNGPFGLGFSYPQLTTYQPSEVITQTSASGMHAPADMPSYRKSSTQLHGSSITYGGYPASSFGAQQMPHYAQYTSQYTPQAFQAPFPTQASEQQERQRHAHHSIAQASSHGSASNPPQASQLFPSGYQGDGDDSDESNGGVRLPASF